MTWEEGGQGDGEEEEVDEEEEERERREMEEEEQEEREGRPDNLTLGAEGFHMKSVHFHCESLFSRADLAKSDECGETSARGARKKQVE